MTHQLGAAPVASELTLESVEVRAAIVPLKRAVISKVGSYDEWPLLLIDLRTSEGIVGRSYLEPYLSSALGPIVATIRELAASRRGRPVRPLDDFQQARHQLNLIGYEGVALIAIAGLDMAAWDALAKVAGMPLARFLGGDLGSVPAYNSNGLWLGDPSALADEAAELVAEGGFSALKLRLGRESMRDDVAALEGVRRAVGSDVELMVDFNQGLSLGEALRLCHALDARPDAHRRHLGLVARRADRCGRRDRGLQPPLPGGLSTATARHRDGRLAGVAGLGQPDPRRAVRAGRRPADRPRSSRMRDRMGRAVGGQMGTEHLMAVKRARRERLRSIGT